MTTERSKLGSAFDGMLEASRSRFNALDRNPDRRPDGAGGARPPDPEPAVASPMAVKAAMPGQKLIQARFGDRWRHDIVERRMDGNEAIVLCKLTIDDQVVQTQFGRATVGGGASSNTASAQGVTFSLGSSQGTAMDREDEAYRLATDDALEKCARLLVSNHA